MCLAVPMRIARLLDAERAVVEQEGVEVEVNVSFIESPRVGDYVIIHAGFALEKLDLEEAEKTLEILRETSEE